MLNKIGYINFFLSLSIYFCLQSRHTTQVWDQQRTPTLIKVFDHSKELRQQPSKALSVGTSSRGKTNKGHSIELS